VTSWEGRRLTWSAMVAMPADRENQFNLIHLIRDFDQRELPPSRGLRLLARLCNRYAVCEIFPVGYSYAHPGLTPFSSRL
jgi:hypothetical protein